MMDPVGQAMMRTLLGVGTAERLDQLDSIRLVSDRSRSPLHTGTQLPHGGCMFLGTDAAADVMS